MSSSPSQNTVEQNEEGENDNVYENNPENAENIKYESDEESRNCSEDENEDTESGENDETDTESVSENECDDEEDELNEFILKQLAKLKKKKKDKKKNQGYIHYLNNFLKMDLKDCVKAISDRQVYDFAQLAQSTVTKQINIGKLPRTDRWMLQNFASGKTKLQDKKNLLLNDYRIHAIFRRAIAVLRKSILREKQTRKRNVASAKTIRSQLGETGTSS